MEAALAVGRHDRDRPGVRAVLGRRRQLRAGPCARRTRAFDAWPVNVGLLGRGSSSPPRPAARGARGRRVRLQGARGHRRAPAHPRHRAHRGRGVRRRRSRVHTDGLNESLSVDDTLAGPRRPGRPRVPRRGLRRRAHARRAAPRRRRRTCSPRRPTRRCRSAATPSPSTVAMIVTCTALRARPARRRRDWPTTGCAPRRWPPRTCCTTSASSPITSSDAQGMGRAGETVRRTFATGRPVLRGRPTTDATATTTSACCATWPS